jgi:hypothetical protein
MRLKRFRYYLSANFAGFRVLLTSYSTMVLFALTSLGKLDLIVALFIVLVPRLSPV